MGLLSLAIIQAQRPQPTPPNPWATITGGGVRIAVDPRGNPWVVNNANAIYKRASNQWTQLPGTGKDIGIGADGSVYVIGTNAVSGGFGIYKYVASSNSWQGIDGGGVRIAVDPRGNPWIVNDAGAIYRRVSNQWRLLPGSAKDIGIGADGTVYVIGTNAVGGGFGIYKYVASSNSWQGIDGGGVQIAVNPRGAPWVVNSANAIYRRVSNQWTLLTGAAKDIGIGADGSVYVIGTNAVSGGFGVFKYNGSR